MPQDTVSEITKARPARSDTSERNGIQSLVRAFAILECIARSSGGLGLVDLSRAVGLHSSTTFNLLRTMLALGYVRQSPTDKRYSIGRSIFCLATTALDEIALVNLATDVLNQLSLVTGETSHFAIWSGNEAIILAKSDGIGAFQLSDRVGGARPAHATALGKILLSGLDSNQLDRYLANANLVRFTPRTITDPQRIREEIEAIAKSELATDDAEFLEEVRCIAVPVRNFENQLVGALGLSGPIWRLSLQAIQQHAGQLRSSAKQLSAELGQGGLAGTRASALSRLQRNDPVDLPLKQRTRV